MVWQDHYSRGNCCQQNIVGSTDVKNNFKSLLEIDTDAALSGDTPMLIDEWQTVPKLWDAVRHTLNHYQPLKRLHILTI